MILQGVLPVSQLLLAGYLLLFLVMVVLGWTEPLFAAAHAPEFSGIAAKSVAIIGRNLGALALLVLGNTITAGVFGAVVFAANGYWAGTLMRASAAHAPVWLWSFVPVEVVAFALAAAVAAPVVFADSGVGLAVRVIGFSAGLLCVSAVFEAVLIQLAWSL